MAIATFALGVILALALLVLLPKAPNSVARGLLAALSLLVFTIGLVGSSVRYVGADYVGIVVKNMLGAPLTGGRIIAADGEMGIQAEVLPPGWHTGYWPFIYDVRTVPLTTIGPDEVGLIEARDGLPLDEGQVFAPPWADDTKQQMLDAKHFLTTGKGRKGAQVSVLTTGKYRINTELFNITHQKLTEVLPGEVAVLKANFGQPASLVVKGVAGEPGAGNAAERAADAVAHPEGRLKLARPGEMGVQAEPLPPGKYAINTNAFKVVEVWTTQMIAHYTASFSSNPASGGAGHTTQEEKEITVRTSDGFTFPVDVRIEYHVTPENAPIVVAKLGDDEGDRFRNQLNSAVRATFRNSAEGVRALDYVQQRSQQEQMAGQQLAKDMAPFGVAVTAVRIGNVGDEKTLGALLKTQTDREIAKQEQQTFQEQQKAAEKKKELSRVTQEAEEEKKLATAAYAVKVAEEDKKKRVIEAGAEAEAISIKAEAQAKAYQSIAMQIGKSNAAMIELLKVIGEKNIQITPRVMITNSPGAGHTGTEPQTAALLGTMLDSMVQKDDEKDAKRDPKPEPKPQPKP